MIEGLASAADVAENSGNAGGIEKPNFDTKEPQDFSGNDINPNNDFSGEMDLLGDNSDKTSSDILDTSQVQDYSGDDLYNSEDFASEKDGNKESEGQIKENVVAEENKPKETTEQSEPKKGDENTDTSDDNLTDEEKVKIKDETGWSDEIIDAIGSWEEYEIYKKAGLVEAEINGRSCLIRSDIDMNQTDDYGRTNKERMEQGLAPLDSQGRPVELHHIGQKMNAPLAELTSDEHRGNGNYSVLHDSSKESEIDRDVFRGQKEEHWQTRAKEIENESN